MSVARLRVAPVLPVYARQDLTFVRGEGTTLYDTDGHAYLDFLAGIAVVGLGHCHPAPLAAAQAQLDRLWHVSNLYWTEPMVELARRLSARAGGARAFFCNSGSESVEAGLKYARKATGKPGIVALNGSFHGRTIGALSVTGQPAKRAAFEPLLPHVQFANPNDVASLEAAISADTGCVLLEPVQGEGGVHVLEASFVAAARRLADKTGAVLLFDEVQTGVGRTGSFFAHERLDVRADGVMLAKGLANGLPIGCLLVYDDAPEGFAAGDHASTFGGNPVTCAAATAVCDELTDEFLATVTANGLVLAAGLAELDGIRAVRGAGLMLGAELDCPPAQVVLACAERGLLVGTAGTDVLRLTPPLIVTAAEIEQALAVLEEVLT
ncbi:MAG: acetylornithine/succinylornithine family transaminase [Actinobacteria bacterium]|nr:MAG: acetylornithine/succinylornithine family transaminase [Actinomycetota bacterium]TML87007.1 MAG: acetylornithine/succinylornithine family transaminase [Actinomycetota bacterium]